MSEKVLSDEEFLFFKNFVSKRIGLQLNDFKKELLISRLGRRLRLLNLNNFSDYIELIKKDPGEATQALSVIATHHTYFNREPHHFKMLEETILPDLISHAAGRSLKIWVAGCAEGAEAYDIAMLIDRHSWLSRTKLSILATDFNPNLVAQARQGLYHETMLKGLEPRLIEKYFSIDALRHEARISAKCRAMVDFKVANLMTDWPDEIFDIIFCRNVMIYFDAATQVKLLSRFNGSLASGGTLILGHAENLHMFAASYQIVGKTIYQKI